MDNQAKARRDYGQKSLRTLTILLFIVVILPFVAILLLMLTSYAIADMQSGLLMYPILAVVGILIMSALIIAIRGHRRYGFRRGKAIIFFLVLMIILCIFPPLVPFLISLGLVPSALQILVTLGLGFFAFLFLCLALVLSISALIYAEYRSGQAPMPVRRKKTSPALSDESMSRTDGETAGKTEPTRHTEGAARRKKESAARPR